MDEKKEKIEVAVELPRFLKPENKVEKIFAMCKAYAFGYVCIFESRG